MEKTTDSRPAIAMVASNSSRLANANEILEAIRGHADGLAISDGAKWEDGILMFEAGETTIAISLMQAPIPWPDLAGPCATAWWWPKAKEMMKGHTHHFLIVVTGGDFDRIGCRVLLTHVVRAVAKSTDAAGVYWAEGTLVHEPAEFIAEAENVTLDDLSIHLWVDVRIEQNPDRSYRCFTTGLSHLGFLEIEAQRSTQPPEYLLSFLLDIVNYIVTNRLQIREGDTMGRSNNEQFSARHSQSMFNRGAVLDLAIP